MSAGSQGTIAHRTLRGMFWAYGSYVGGRVLVLISTVVLARVLTPEDFGLVALALTFMVFLDTVKDLGLGQALIVAPDDELQARAQTVFGWSLLIGAALSGLTALVSPLAGSFFGRSDLTPLLAVLGLNFFLRSLGATPYALARRALNYRARTCAEIADVVTRGSIGIALALLGFGAWSLVIGYLVGTSAMVVTIWHQVRFRPRPRLTRAHLPQLLSFGGILTLVDIGQAFAHELDYIFIGRVLGATPLGLYSIGFRLPELIIINLAIVAGNVLFPSFSLMDRRKLADAFLMSLRYMAMLVLPLAVGMAILARPIILTVFGPAWEPAIPVMQILSVYAVVVTLNVPAGTVYKVTGRAWMLIAFTIPYVITLFVALLIFTPNGITAVAGVMAGLQALFAVVGWAVTTRVLRVSIFEIARTLAGPAMAAATMAVVLIAATSLVSGSLATLVVGLVAGALGYGAGILLFAGDAVARLRAIAAPRLSAAGAGRT